MLKSRLEILKLHRPTNRPIKDVLQATISNQGVNSVLVFGETLLAGEKFRIDSSNTVFELELEKIEFPTSGDAYKNHVNIAYQVLQLDQC